MRSGSRRVMALVPYAAEGNAIPSLSEGLRHDLELSLSHLAEISWVRLQFPETFDHLSEDSASAQFIRVLIGRCRRVRIERRAVSYQHQRSVGKFIS